MGNFISKIVKAIFFFFCIWGSSYKYCYVGYLYKFPDFFRMDTFIDITQMKLYSLSE